MQEPFTISHETIVLIAQISCGQIRNKHRHVRTFSYVKLDLSVTGDTFVQTQTVRTLLDSNHCLNMKVPSMQDRPFILILISLS